MPSVELRRLATVDRSSLTVVGYRNRTPGFDPKSGEGARRFGGRFNPPKSFPVVYLCLTRPCVKAELTRQAERQGIGSRTSYLESSGPYTSSWTPCWT